jgi:hypothetical protein
VIEKIVDLRKLVELGLLVTGLFGVVAQPAAAVNWTKYDQARSFDAYIDLDSMHSKDGIVRVWEKWEYVNPQKTDQGQVKTYLLSRAINCDERRSAITAWVHRDASGKALNFGETQRSTWSYTEQVPGSVGASLIEYVCKNAPAEKGKEDALPAPEPTSAVTKPSDAIPPSLKNAMPPAAKNALPPSNKPK